MTRGRKREKSLCSEKGVPSSPSERPVFSQTRVGRGVRCQSAEEMEQHRRLFSLFIAVDLLCETNICGAIKAVDLAYRVLCLCRKNNNNGGEKRYRSVLSGHL